MQKPRQHHPGLLEQKQLVDKYLASLSAEAVRKYLLSRLSLELISMQQLASNGVINFTFLLSTSPTGSEVPRRLLLRVANPHSFWTRIKTENEVALLRLIRQQTSLPVPRVLDFASDATASPLGLEFILMDYIESDMHLGDYIQHRKEDFEEGRLSSDQLVDSFRQLLEQGYTAVKEMFTVCLPQSQQYICGLTLDLQPAPITWDGPSVSPCRSVAEFIRTCLTQSLEHYRHRMSSESDSRIKGKFEELLPCIEAVRSHVAAQCGNSKSEGPFLLRHADLHPGNICVRAGKIVGIFDWEHSRIEPIFSDSDEVNLARVWFGDAVPPAVLQDLTSYERQLKETLSLDSCCRQGWEEFRQCYSLCEEVNWSWFYVQNWWQGSDTALWEHLLREESARNLESARHRLSAMKYIGQRLLPH